MVYLIFSPMETSMVKILEHTCLYIPGDKPILGPEECDCLPWCRKYMGKATLLPHVVNVEDKLNYESLYIKR